MCYLCTWSAGGENYAIAKGGVFLSSKESAMQKNILQMQTSSHITKK